MADFLEEFNNLHPDEKEPPMKDTWVIDVGSSSTLKYNGVGIVLTTLDGLEVGYVFRMEFKTTNNKASYRGKAQNGQGAQGGGC